MYGGRAAARMNTNLIVYVEQHFDTKDAALAYLKSAGLIEIADEVTGSVLLVTPVGKTFGSADVAPYYALQTAMLAQQAFADMLQKGHKVTLLHLYSHLNRLDALLEAVGDSDTVLFSGPCYINTYPADTTALLQAAIDQSPTGIIVADAPGGKLRLLNAAARDILALQPDESMLEIAFTEYAPSWRALRPDGTGRGAQVACHAAEEGRLPARAVPIAVAAR